MESNSEDYYEILGISRDASEDIIKKAYRKLALRWHPDKNLERRELAEKNFKRLAEAYEVLSDPKKRIIYDRYGKDGLVNGGADPTSSSGFGFPNMADFFGGVFGPSGHRGMGGGVFGFGFRDPNEVFREFFSGDTFADFHHGGGGEGGHGFDSGQRNDGNTDFSAGFFDPFSMFGQNMFNGQGGMNMQMSSSTMLGGDGSNVKRISTSVKTVNGKKIETKRVFENGVETVTVMEDGRVKSKTVNGQPQLPSN